MRFEVFVLTLRPDERLEIFMSPLEIGLRPEIITLGPNVNRPQIPISGDCIISALL